MDYFPPPKTEGVWDGYLLYYHCTVDEFMVSHLKMVQKQTLLPKLNYILADFEFSFYTIYLKPLIVLVLFSSL